MPNPDGSLTPEEQAAADAFNTQGLPQATPVDTLSPEEQQTVKAFNAQVGGVGPNVSLHPQQTAVIPPLYAAPPPNADRAAAAPAPAAQPDIQLQAPPPGPQLAGPPPIERTGRTSTTETDRKIITPAEKALQAQADNTAQDQQDLARQQTPIDVANAQAKADAAQAAAAQAVQQQQLVKTALDQGQAYYDQRMARYQQLEQEHQGKQLHSFFDDPKNGSKVVAGIAAFLSPQAIPIIQDRMNRDMELQKANIEKSRQDLERAKGDVELARQYKADRLADLNLKFASANQTAAAALEQQLKKNGVPEAQIQGDARVLDFKQKAEALKQKWFDDTRNTTRNVVQTTYAQTTGQQPKSGAGGAATSLRREKIDANLAGMDEGLREAEANRKELTPAVLQKVQDNERKIEAAKHAGPLTSLGMNTVGLVPRDKYQGLSEAAKKAYRGAEQALQHGSEMQASTGIEAQRQWIDKNSPLSPTNTQAEINQRIGALRKTHGEYRAYIAPGGPASRMESGAPPPARMSPAEATATVSFIRSNPNDPRAKAAKELLRAQGWIK